MGHEYRSSLHLEPHRVFNYAFDKRNAFREKISSKMAPRGFQVAYHRALIQRGLEPQQVILPG